MPHQGKAVHRRMLACYNLVAPDMAGCPVKLDTCQPGPVRERRSTIKPENRIPEFLDRQIARSGPGEQRIEPVYRLSVGGVEVVAQAVDFVSLGEGFQKPTGPYSSIHIHYGVPGQ